MGYTLEQLQKMGATPVAPKRGYTSDELKKLGAKPLNFQETPEPKETTWGTIKSIAKELPGAMKTVATAPFKTQLKLHKRLSLVREMLVLVLLTLG